MKKLKFDNMVLAPLAGISDFPFRKICSEFGCEWLFSEMISVNALHYKDRATFKMVESSSLVRPVSIQLFGDDPERFAEASEYIEKNNSGDAIDVNCGCPVKKVVRNHAGCILMDEPHLCGKIVKAIKKRTALPVTVKFRTGCSKKNFLEFGKIMEDSGADMLILHPRTKEQMFGGKSDWNQISLLKQQVKIPVIGSGDIHCGSDFVKMLGETGCDGGMVGRATYGNPWIFKEIKEKKDFLKNHILPFERRLIMKKHLSYAIEHYGERIGCILMRKHLCFYSKGVDFGSEFRNRVNWLETENEICDLIDKMIIDKEEK